MPSPLCRPPKLQAPGLVGTSKTHSSPCVAVKLGKCPLDRLHCLSPIKHVCNQDSNCSGKKRCCLSACGRDCRDPSKGIIPGGQDRVFLSNLALGCPSRLKISAGHLPQKRGPQTQPQLEKWGARAPTSMAEKPSSSVLHVLCHRGHSPELPWTSVCPSEGGWGALS